MEEQTPNDIIYEELLEVEFAITNRMIEVSKTDIAVYERQKKNPRKYRRLRSNKIMEIKKEAYGAVLFLEFMEEIL
ncbi:MAG TPA: hypothetical protein ENI23_03115 [bacterium]|nr:hypothetical protein [bacterium]